MSSQKEKTNDSQEPEHSSPSCLYFDRHLAKELGSSDAAVIVQNLAYWIRKNRAKGLHFYDGHTWTYNTSKALAILLCYLSEDQIDRVIKKLVDRGILETGNYNKKRYDRTRWYAFVDEARFLDGFTAPTEDAPAAEPVTPPPPALAYVEAAKDEEKPAETTPAINIPFESFWDVYAKKEGSKSDTQKLWEGRKNTENGKPMNGADREAVMTGIAAYVAKKQNPIPGVFEPEQPLATTFLNKRRWENDSYQPAKQAEAIEGKTRPTPEQFKYARFIEMLTELGWDKVATLPTLAEYVAMGMLTYNEWIYNEQKRRERAEQIKRAEEFGKLQRLYLQTERIMKQLNLPRPTDAEIKAAFDQTGFKSPDEVWTRGRMGESLEEAKSKLFEFMRQLVPAETSSKWDWAVRMAS